MPLDLSQTFVSLVRDSVAQLAESFELNVEVASSSQLRLVSAAVVVNLELSAGHAWQLAAAAAPTDRTAELGASDFVALGFVLQALTNGVETYSPRWLTTEAQLMQEIERVRGRLSRHADRLFRGPINWPRAREFAAEGIARATAAASGRSRLARQLEAAEAAFGRDDFAACRASYENLGQQLGPVEVARLEICRRR